MRFYEDCLADSRGKRHARDVFETVGGSDGRGEAGGVRERGEKSD